MRLDDPQLLAALARLNENPDFRRFMNVYVQTLLADAMQLCVEAEHPARHQGAAQILQQIQHDLNEAEEAFYKVTRQGEIPLP